MTRWEWAGAVAIVVIIAGVIVFAVRDCNQRGECEDRGGRVVEYDCTTSLHCSTSDGVTNCYPIESCKWRCVMPERSAP